ncbi:coat protein [ssRNA phage AIN002]|uniref:Coat protein n=1 Tax=ssRNA phage AIN002 TaxID=2785985 RepID=A0A8S5KXR0_9VIRU|nr:coat protein [ssRNA phage AIN002]DAD49845.1 TPA_asm: coat protein [ssRNA phage AIN002]
MPQLQTLVLTDRATTPVNRTFIPRDIDKDGMASVAHSTGVPVGDQVLTIQTTRTRTGRIKVLIQGKFPVVATETVNGVSMPKVIRYANANHVFYFDATSTEQERNDVVGMMASAYAPTKELIHATLVKLEGVY